MKVLECLLNKLLPQDPETADKLAGLSGKTLQIELLNTAQPVISLSIQERGVCVTTDYEGDADVLIRGTPLNFLAYLSSAGQQPALAGSLELRGDTGLAQEVQGLLRGYAPDLEGRAACVLGDTLARKASGLAHTGLGFLAHLKNKIELDLSEYVLYEAEILPDCDEIERFNHSVDVLRDDLERCKHRFHRLNKSA